MRSDHKMLYCKRVNVSLGVPIRSKAGRALGMVLVEIQVDDALEDALSGDPRFYIVEGLMISRLAK